MRTDAELLEQFTREGAQEAYAELVRRHIGMVYGAALRHVGGDAHLAQKGAPPDGPIMRTFMKQAEAEFNTKVEAETRRQMELEIRAASQRTGASVPAK